MKFNQLHPNAAEGFKSKDYVGIFLSGSEGTCIICGQKTNWIDGDFDSFTCSEECAIQVLEDFLKECHVDKTKYE